MAEIQGTNEFEIFKNFYSRSVYFVRCLTQNLQTDCKNDIKSERLRESALKEYRAKNYYNCLEIYTKSLCIATYDGPQYALALANRSATYFAMKLYQNCINDINLSLQANYPNKKKSKLYFRKIKCYGNMGKRPEMLHEVDECSKFIAQCPGISKTQQENLLQEIKSFVDDVKDVKIGTPLEEISFVLDQEIKEPNTENSCASSAIVFKHGKGKNTEVEILAARDIQRGEVLFVEKGFVGFHHQVHDNDGSGVFYCDLCCEDARNCVPCKTCITVVYCSEACRDAAWNDYHKWECKIFRKRYLENGYFLPLRFVVKAASVGSINGIINKSPSDTETKNQFLEIYKFPVNFEVLRRDHETTLMKACSNATQLVVALKSAKFFDFLMSTPYYTDKTISDLMTYIGGMILKNTIQTFQRSLVVNRLSPVIDILNGNQDMFKLSYMKVKSAAAFCPTISGLPHSCITNTSTSFQRDICTVKAFKNIKAGDFIYRTVYHINAHCPSFDRKDLMEGLAIICKCEACKNIKNTYENLNTFVCHNCGGRADFDIEREGYFVNCVDCNIGSEMIPSIKLKLEKILKCRWFDKGDTTTLTLPETLTALTDLNGLVQPYHSAIATLWKHLKFLYSKTANVKKFLEALKNSKRCCEMKFSADSFQYVFCFGDICNDCFQFLYNNKGKLQKQEAEEMIDYFIHLIQEAKEVISVEFPYLVNMFIPADIYLRQFKIDYLQIEGL